MAEMEFHCGESDKNRKSKTVVYKCLSNVYYFIELCIAQANASDVPVAEDCLHPCP